LFGSHLESGDGAGVLGGLALGVVEVGGHRDDGARHRLAEEGLGIRLELKKQTKHNSEQRSIGRTASASALGSNPKNKRIRKEYQTGLLGPWWRSACVI